MGHSWGIKWNGDPGTPVCNCKCNWGYGTQENIPLNKNNPTL